MIDLATHNIPSSASWRIPVGLQLVWGLILISGIFFLPESPRHLLGKDRTDEARKVIAELNAVPEDDPIVLDALEELQVGIHAENEGGKATWAECFSTRNMLWKRTMNGMMLQFIQQLNGQNFYCEWSDSILLLLFILTPVKDYYGDTFFKSAGTTCVIDIRDDYYYVDTYHYSVDPFVIQVILGAVSVAGTVPALYLIETLGRRKVGLSLPIYLKEQY